DECQISDLNAARLRVRRRREVRTRLHEVARWIRRAGAIEQPIYGSAIDQQAVRVQIRPSGQQRRSAGAVGIKDEGWKVGKEFVHETQPRLAVFDRFGMEVAEMTADPERVLRERAGELP